MCYCVSKEEGGKSLFLTPVLRVRGGKNTKMKNSGRDLHGVCTLLPM